MAFAIARSFCHWTFLLLDVYSPWLLLAVSVTRHFLLLAITQRFLYSTYPRKGTTCNFTQRFHYPSFQLLDRRFSAPALLSQRGCAMLRVCQ